MNVCTVKTNYIIPLKKIFYGSLNVLLLHVLQSNNDYINKQKIMELITSIICCDKIIKYNLENIINYNKCIIPAGL